MRLTRGRTRGAVEEEKRRKVLTMQMMGLFFPGTGHGRMHRLLFLRLTGDVCVYLVRYLLGLIFWGLRNLCLILSGGCAVVACWRGRVWDEENSRRMAKILKLLGKEKTDAGGDQEQGEDDEEEEDDDEEEEDEEDDRRVLGEKYLVVGAKAESF